MYQSYNVLRIQSTILIIANSLTNSGNMLPAFRQAISKAPVSNVRLYKTVRAKRGITGLKQINDRHHKVIYEVKQQKRANIYQEKATEQKEKAESANETELPMIAYKLDCPGCGAKYQHNNSEKPGFLPYDTMATWDSKSPVPCERCTGASDTEFHQMYSIDEARFKRIIKKIGSRRSVGVVVCDIVGFPGTLPPDIEKIYPAQTPIVLCLNKCDVLASSAKQLQIVQEYYRLLVEKWEKTSRFTFTDLVFTSARTGTGLPELSLLIQQYMYEQEFGEFDFCYLIGMTNAGKSTMFNKLSPLLSNRMRCIGNVTESPLPGTTVKNINSPVDPPEHSIKATGKSVYKRADVLHRLLSDQDESTDQGYAHWFKSKIDLQLANTTNTKMIIDTPGVLPENAIPEATFTCQSEVTSKTVSLHPGEVLSFGWYKVFYVRGNTSVNFRINSPMVSSHEILYSPPKDVLNISPDGTELQNKLYVMHNINNFGRGPVGDIVLGNFAWVSVGLGLGEDITVCVLGPRLEDISYRTPAFSLRVPRAEMVKTEPVLKETDQYYEDDLDDNLYGSAD